MLQVGIRERLTVPPIIPILIYLLGILTPCIPPARVPVISESSLPANEPGTSMANDGRKSLPKTKLASSHNASPRTLFNLLITTQKNNIRKFSMDTSSSLQVQN